MKVALVLLTCVCLMACTWVKPEEGAQDIALVKPAHVETCKKLGTASATSKSKVLGITRGERKVAEELLVLAKNEALSLGGDTLVSETSPEEGQQHFSVYKCRDSE